MNELETKLLCYFQQYARGFDNRKEKGELVYDLLEVDYKNGERTIRKGIEGLREKGHIIVSHSAIRGYFLADLTNEIDREHAGIMKGDLINRGASIQLKIDMLKRELDKTRGDLALKLF